VKRQEDLYLKSANIKAKVGQANIGNEHLVVLLPKAVIFEDVVKEIKNQITTTEMNIGFLYQNKQGYFCSHVYERGVGFTRSCGTGASAAASFLAFLAQPQEKISLNLYQPGGAIYVNVLAKSIENNNGSFVVDQCSKATLVFTGIFQASDTC
jgi:diaminopimelate epimerase